MDLRMPPYRIPIKALRFSTVERVSGIQAPSPSHHYSVTSSLRHFSRVTGGIPPDLLERTPTNFDDEAIPTPGFSLTGGGRLPNIGGRRKDGE
jgi:hypothetical protein